MNCVEWEERIALYAGGELVGEEAVDVERHLGQCLGCQVFASGMRQSLDWLKSAHQDLPDPAHFAAVRSRVLSELSGADHRFLWSVIAAAVAAAALLMAILTVRHSPKAPVPEPVVARVQATEPPIERAAPRKSRPKARRRRPMVVAKAPPHEEAHPLVVKLVTDDPNVVIYWISENRRGE